MEEPMDDGPPEGAHQENHNVDNGKDKSPSSSKPGLSYSMVMMTITAEDYQNQYWPKLESAIRQLLTMTPGEYIPISYEQMYSCVYKCVCKQFSERLYSDLVKLITDHLAKVAQDLQAPPQDSAQRYIEKFNYAMNQYLTALGGIVPIFNYMNRFFVVTKMKTDLNVELMNLFIQHVADKHVPILIPLLVEANLKPFSVSPPVMANLISNLYKFKPEFAQVRPHLFAKYLPNILPPCQETDLNNYIEETRQMQRDLLRHPDFIRGDQNKKRRSDDEPPKSTPLNFLPRTSSS